jgi:hypothetical protein
MKLYGMVALVLGFAPVAQSQGGFSPPIRVATPITGRCVNAKTDEVTVTLRRIVTQKYGGFFTQDDKAGVTVMATLNGTGDASAKTPSVNQVDVQKEKNGQVSLALEYAVADLLVLSQGSTVTKNIQLDLFMAKTRGKNTFGTILDVAGQALSKLPIPSNPYTTGASKFLQFANQAIQSQTGAQAALQFASLTLAFNDRDQSDVNACLNDGFQPTGALAVFRDTGPANTQLLPIADLSQKYCFRYTTQFTYELQYVPRPATGCTNTPENAWHEVPNDYVMVIINAQKPPTTSNKSLSNMPPNEKALWEQQRRTDLKESKALCNAMRLPLRNCGV